MKLTSKRLSIRDMMVNIINLKYIASGLSCLFLLLNAPSFAQRYDIPVDEKQPYDNVPISSKTWEEIDIAWKNPYDKDKPNTAKLLRPISYVNRHHFIVSKSVNLKMTDVGVPNIGATIIAIKPITYGLAKQLISNTQPVIGYFRHYVNNVKTYRFMDKKGQITKIHATPNHLIYVKNLHAFLPVTNIDNSMLLVGENNQDIYLLCPGNKVIHCGKPYRAGHIITVYNVEVYHDHVYRVGNIKLLVHNNKGESNSLRAKVAPLIGRHEGSNLNNQTFENALLQSFKDIARMNKFTLISKEGIETENIVADNFSVNTLADLQNAHGDGIYSLNLDALNTGYASMFRDSKISVTNNMPRYTIDLQNNKFSMVNDLTVAHLDPDIDELEQSIQLTVQTERNFQLNRSVSDKYFIYGTSHTIINWH